MTPILFQCSHWVLVWGARWANLRWAPPAGRHQALGLAVGPGPPGGTAWRTTNFDCLCHCWLSFGKWTLLKLPAFCLLYMYDVNVVKEIIVSITFVGKQNSSLVPC